MHFAGELKPVRVANRIPLSLRGAFAALTLGGLLSIGAHGANSDFSGWEMIQRSSFSGQQHCYLCKKGVRIESTLIDTIIDFDKGTVTMFKDSLKSYCTMTYDQWKGQFAQNKNKLKKEREIKKGITAKISGVEAVQYLLLNKDRTEKHLSEEYWTASPKEIPAKFTAPLSELVGLPPELGVPLRVTQRKRDGRTLNVLETLKVTRSTFGPKLLQCPSGYKQVKDAVSLVLGESE